MFFVSFFPLLFLFSLLFSFFHHGFSRLFRSKPTNSLKEGLFPKNKKQKQKKNKKWFLLVFLFHSLINPLFVFSRSSFFFLLSNPPCVPPLKVSLYFLFASLFY